QDDRRIVADADDVAVLDRKEVDYARHARARYMTHDAVERSARLEPPAQPLDRLGPDAHVLPAHRSLLPSLVGRGGAPARFIVSGQASASASASARRCSWYSRHRRALASCIAVSTAAERSDGTPSGPLLARAQDQSVGCTYHAERYAGWYGSPPAASAVARSAGSTPIQHPTSYTTSPTCTLTVPYLSQRRRLTRRARSSAVSQESAYSSESQSSAPRP